VRRWGKVTLMRDPMPTLGRSPRRGTWWKISVPVLLVLGGAWLLLRKGAPTDVEVPPDAQAPAWSDAGSAPAANPPGDGGEAAPARPAASEELDKAGLKRVNALVDGPLERAIVEQVGRQIGLPLVQVTVRALVWWIDVPSGLRRGDRVQVLYATRAGAEPLVHAVRFTSEKTGQTHAAYRFQATGDAYGRLWSPTGEELEQRIEDGPLDDYEQVSSLLRDGRGHHGVDFRTPVGTPVKAPFDALVRRKTWAFKMNGNSLDLEESGGAHRRALLLHLSAIDDPIKPGVTVKRGQVLARSGNTGHSFAPHLHYELHGDGGALLDPFRSHTTTRRALPEGDRTRFDTEVKRLEQLLDLP